jgi:hypothetical protein
MARGGEVGCLGRETGVRMEKVGIPGENSLYT